jgi:hypothetical protein
VLLAFVTTSGIMTPSPADRRPADDVLPALRQELKEAGRFGMNFAPWGAAP